ncbi:hypothetical protein AVEN_112000-1 [Araneus ventricosus]|uniref:Uncharacterized protein n=1 Tax=Araneus ventricosus TaxID=182803 RepID=A0A4Y2HZG1_ARAVE|nr:hypothetical protein AVEN_112000-1 [Araneus ventricosus]
MDKGRKTLVHITFPHIHHGCRRTCAIAKRIYRDRPRRNQVVEPLNDGVLNCNIGSEMATCQVLPQGPEEMKFTWCEIRVVGRVFQCLCGDVLGSSAHLFL